MKITCPNCNTSYQVPDDYIGSNGRSVKCANCGETWHAVEDKPAPPSPPPAKDLEEGLDTSQDDIDALFDSPGEEQSQDDIDALFDSPSGGGEDQSQDDIDALFDSPSGEGEDQSQDDIDALFDTPGGGEEQSQDDIDSLFDSPASEPEPASDEGADPIVVQSDAGGQGDSPVVDMMDAAAFEAQKAIARGSDIESSVRRRQRRKKGAPAPKSDEAKKLSMREWIIGGSALAATVMLVIGLFAAPSFWVKSFPDLASLYNMAGISVNVGGVDISMVDVKLAQQAGSPVIAIETELVNPGVEPVILPSVQFSILGNGDSELYSWVIEPDSVGLGPGERKTIETSVAAPPQAKYVSLRIFHQ